VRTLFSALSALSALSASSVSIDTISEPGYTNPLMPNPETRSRRSAAVWWGAALVALGIGYADLARGGITLAPVMLVLGYCVLVPLAILK
jgi:hypothetical protein